jgi:GTP-binding protein
MDVPAGMPLVAIVGRPNVGKSSILNWISRRMVSIVEATPGVTRDRVSTICAIDDTYFELVDTGGYGIEDHDNLTEHVERQISYAISRAHLILFVVDTRDGLVPLDVEVANLLRPHQDRVLLVANKADDAAIEPDVAEFLRLGYGEALPVSALHRLGRGALQEIILDRLGDVQTSAPTDPIMQVAVIGRQNTGKSTFINALAGEEHVIVSEIPGTTRDAVDLRFEQDGRAFIAIDTAGVKKKSKWAASIEFYGYTRVMHSIRRADVNVLFIDSTEAITTADKKLARAVSQELKPCVLVINKWDLAKDAASTDAYGDYLTKTLPEARLCPGRVHLRPRRAQHRRGHRHRVGPVQTGPRAGRYGRAQSRVGRGAVRTGTLAQAGQSAAAHLLRHAGGGGTADHRVLRQPPQEHQRRLQALPAQPHAGTPALRGGAHSVILSRAARRGPARRVRQLTAFRRSSYIGSAR